MAKRLNIVEEKFLDTIKNNNLINSGDKIVVGVSGGPDSLTLLTLLNKYKSKFNYEIIVAHVNHLIRKDSTDDEQFVENYCKKNGIKFYCKRVNVQEIAKQQKKGEEEVGRNERYKFFDEICEKENANKIAIAHNMNDNAETMLLNLIRGTGLNGLEGIQPSQYNNRFIRPLINCNRNEIEDFCKENNLEPRIDSTNKENIYKRNIIRNKLIPFLKELNPNIIETLSRTSVIIAENNEFIQKEAQKNFNKIAELKSNEIKNKTSNEIENKTSNEINNKISNNYDTKEREATNCSKKSNLVEIDVKEFNKMPIAMRKAIIQLSIEKLNGNIKNISKKNIDDIIKLGENNIGNKYIIYKNIKAEVKKGKLKIQINERQIENSN